MKRVLFSMVLLMAVSFSFAQMKNEKEAKSMANDVKPNFKQAEQLIIVLKHFQNTIVYFQCIKIGRAHV